METGKAITRDKTHSKTIRRFRLGEVLYFLLEFIPILLSVEPYKMAIREAALNVKKVVTELVKLKIAEGLNFPAAPLNADVPDPPGPTFNIWDGGVEDCAVINMTIGILIKIVAHKARNTSDLVNTNGKTKISGS